jgi:myo-inositol 2-dehydrogenase/D-chiro-inositol 1-dehydrogenase
MSENIRFAILGAGRMGRIRATHLATHPDARLASVHDEDSAAAASLASDFGTDATLDLDAALATADAVFICTPAHAHAELIAAAAARGKAIFCEKPLASSTDAARQAVETAEAAAVVATIGFSKRFDPARRALEMSVRKGEIGNVEMVLLTNRDPGTVAFRPLLDYLRAQHDSAPFGLIRESTVHDMDTARALLGAEPSQLHAVGSNLSSAEMAEMGEPDAVMLTLKTASGSMCHINGSWRTAYGYDQRIEVVGSEGMLRWENGPRPPVFHYDRSGVHAGRMFEGPEIDGPDCWMYTYSDAYPAETHDFVDCLKAGRSPDVTLRDGLRAQVLVEAAVSSLQSGGPVDIPPD